MRSPTFQPLTTVCFHTRYARMYPLYSFFSFFLSSFLWINCNRTENYFFYFSEMFVIFPNITNFSLRRFVTSILLFVNKSNGLLFSFSSNSTVSAKVCGKNSDRKVFAFVNSFDEILTLQKNRILIFFFFLIPGKSVIYHHTSCAIF